MKKDIEIPVSKNVFIAIVKDWNEEFQDHEWVAYIINNTESFIEMVMVVSQGFNDDKKTSTMRHSIPMVEAKSFKKIELVQEDVLALNNVFSVTYFADNKLYDKRFLFEQGSFTEDKISEIALIEKDGVLAF